METCIIKLVRINQRQGKFIGLGELTLQNSEGLMTERVYIENDVLKSEFMAILEEDCSHKNIYFIADISKLEFQKEQINSTLSRSGMSQIHYAYTSVAGGVAKIISKAKASDIKEFRVFKKHVVEFDESYYA